MEEEEYKQADGELQNAGGQVQQAGQQHQANCTDDDTRNDDSDHSHSKYLQLFATTH